MIRLNQDLNVFFLNIKFKVESLYLYFDWSQLICLKYSNETNGA